uniref:Paraoxonase n=2 Tax=Arion vulgaris TaxID=1028688 RepID=A0A0B7BHS6_9EUPU
MIREAVKVAILAVVIYKVVEISLKHKTEVHYKKHYPGECRAIEGFNFGSEDFEVTKDGLAFITSGLWFSTMSAAYQEYIKINNIKGNIYLYDFKQPELGARKLKLKSSKELNLDTFHPHGISILEDVIKGEHLIYVISHREHADDAVEKFRYLSKTNELVHLKSFSGDKLQLTNDLSVIEEDKFYITNFLYFNNHYLSILEHSVIPFSLGSLVYFNGTDFNVVISGLNSPNGLVLSKDKKYLYMNIPRSRSINVYEVQNDNSLVQIQSVDVQTLPDNLHLSQSGDALYTGAHPVLHKVAQHLGDPKHKAPSSVLHIPLKNGKIVLEKITELFYDHGDLISGSSVAAVYNRQLLIGSVIDKLVICDVNVNI